MTYDSERFYNIARRQSEKYTHILYLPPRFPPPEDGFRWTDPDYQKQIDRLMRMTLYEWDLLPRTYTINAWNEDETRSKEERVKEALACVKAQQQ